MDIQNEFLGEDESIDPDIYKPPCFYCGKEQGCEDVVFLIDRTWFKFFVGSYLGF